MSGDVTSKISVPSFDSEEQKFALWWMRFKARGLVMGFSQVLDGVKEVSSPTSAEDTLDLSKSQ